MRQVRLVVLMALSTLLLSGCFRYQSSVTVAADGTGAIQEILVVDRGAASRLLGSDDAAAAHLPRAASLSLPAWATARDYAINGYEGVVVDASFDGPEQGTSRLNELHRRLATTVGSAAGSNVELQRIDGGWQFTMETTDLAQVPSLPGTDPTAYAGLYHRAELVIALQLPGNVVEHNADELRDGRLVWHLSAQSVQTQIFARSSTDDALVASARTSRGLEIATALATVGGLGVFATVAISRRRQAGTEPALEVALRHLGDAAPPDPGPLEQWPTSPPAGPPLRPPPPHAGPPPAP